MIYILIKYINKWIYFCSYICRFIEGYLLFNVRPVIVINIGSCLMGWNYNEVVEKLSDCSWLLSRVSTKRLGYEFFFFF